MGNPTELIDDLDNNDDILNEDIREDNEDKTENEYIREGILDSDKIINLGIPGSVKLAPGKQLYKCVNCEAIYNSKQALIYHTRSKHEGVRYSCNQCEYQATRHDSLKTHKQSVHEGIKYSCNQCDYQTGWRQQMDRHKSRKHLVHLVL